MKLKELCTAIGVECPAEANELEIPSITTYSKEVGDGGMFIAIRGLHTDGHSYIGEALERGAAVIVAASDASVELHGKAMLLRVLDPRRATACLYNAFYGYPAQKLRFIGVTGTNGKTSVTHLLRRILEAALLPCGLIGTVGCESRGHHLEVARRDPLANMTTPDPEELYRMLSMMVADGVEYVVMEVTSHALALGKLEPISFVASVFTNLTPEHLDFHGSMEAYADAKAELFAKSECSVINVDSPHAARMLAMAGGDIVTCSAEGKRATYQALDAEPNAAMGVRYTLSSANRRMKLRCPIPGRFTVMNSMQAAITAVELGIGPSIVKDALASVAGVKGRMERVKLGPSADITVLIDYAHTPDALENLLRTATELKEEHSRIHLVFGCGGDRDRSKRAPMGSIAARLADEVILTSDNSRSEDPKAIVTEILRGIPRREHCHVILDRERAIRFAVANAAEGDLILLAGKGHEAYEIGRDGRRPFCEEQIVKDAFTIRMNRKKHWNDRATEEQKE